MASSKNKTSSWTRKYFVVEERDVIDKKTKTAKSELFDVCNLPKIENEEPICGMAFKHNHRNDTKALQRHLVQRHGLNSQIAEEIQQNNINEVRIIGRIMRVYRLINLFDLEFT